ncbi:unnamed protein product, partial [marine sediment metagenome]
MSNTTPLQTIMVPNVVIKEGIPNFNVTTPFKAPIPQQKIKETMVASKTWHPVSISIIVTMGARAKTEPT